MFYRSGAREHHSAIISLVCNDTLAENESFFEYVGTQNMPTDTYVSIIALQTLLNVIGVNCSHVILKQGD